MNEKKVEAVKNELKLIAKELFAADQKESFEERHAKKEAEFNEFYKKFEDFMKNKGYKTYRDPMSFEWQYEPSLSLTGVYIRLYIHGEFPTDMEKFKKAVDEYPKAYKELEKQKKDIENFANKYGYKIFYQGI